MILICHFLSCLAYFSPNTHIRTHSHVLPADLQVCLLRIKFCLLEKGSNFQCTFLPSLHMKEKTTTQKNLANWADWRTSVHFYEQPFSLFHSPSSLLRHTHTLCLFVHPLQEREDEAKRSFLVLRPFLWFRAVPSHSLLSVARATDGRTKGTEKEEANKRTKKRLKFVPRSLAHSLRRPRL